MTICPHCGEDVRDGHEDDETGEVWHVECLAVFECCHCRRTSFQIPIHDNETMPCMCGETMRIR
jgi:hypothetical protein